MSQALARFLVFFASASVLVIEILAMRLLAPYLGVSLGVFTGVIGVILGGIALGAWIGGRAADKGDPARLLGPMIVAGGLTAMVAPFVVDWIGPSLGNDAASIVLAATVAFLIPAVFLSTVPPLVVKIRLSSLDETGTVVGSYSAVGTAGAIFGTFVTGFVLVASFPTRPIIVVLGGVMVAIGLVLATTKSRWQTVTAIVATVVLGGLLLVVPGPCDVETTYHCALVISDTDPPGGRLLILDRLHNSFVDLDDPTYLRFRYIELIADIVDTSRPDGALNVVSIGGGGMTLPGYFAATRPGSSNVALEIDGGVVEIARTQLGLSDDVQVVVADARISLRSIESGWADVVIGDAFSGASVPWHLTTVEYMEDIRRALSGTGLYTMNVIDTRGLHFARAAAATLVAVFDHVAVFAPPSFLTGQGGGNFVMVASDQPIPISSINAARAARGGLEVGVEGTELAVFIDNARVLRDDFAPVDQMLGRS